MEDSARNRAAQLQAVLDQTQEGFLVVGLEGTIQYANARATQLVGRPVAKLIGSPLDIPISPERIQTLDFQPAGQPARTVEMNAVRSEWEGSPAWLVHLHDVTEREAAEKALKENEDLLERTNQVAKVGGWEVDLNTGCLQWTAVTRDILEVERETEVPPIEEALPRFYPEGSLEVVQENLERARREAVTVDFVTWLVTARGRSRWVRIIARPEVQEGQTTRLLGTFQDVTEQKETEEALQEKSHLLEMATRLVQLGGWSVDLTTDRVIWSDAVCAIHEVSPGISLSLEESLRYFAPEWRDRVWEIYQECTEEGRPYDVELEVLTEGNERKWVRSTGEPVFDETGELVEIRGARQDITERKEAERQLRLAGSVYNHASEGIMIADANGDIVAVNPAFTEITGYTEAEVLGRNPRFLQSGYQDKAFYAAMWQTIHDEGRWTGEIWDRHKDGRIVQEWLTVTRVYDAAGAISHYVAVFKDITSLQETKQELQFLANRDPLTHAANRGLLDSSLDQAMDRADREGGRVAVLVLDVDGFKRINDIFGHSKGDGVLIDTANRLASNIRSTDTLGRQGGDEFAVIMEGIGPPEAASEMAQRLIAAMEEPFRVGNRDIGLGASIGISVYPDDAGDKKALFSGADTALLEAEKAGGRTFAYYQAEMTRRASERLLLEQDLRKGIDRDELALHFQPQNRLEDETVVGLEVLVRWNHPEQGLLTPDRFIPLAEEGHLISALTQWVCRHACWQGRRWLDAGKDFGRLSVNISATDFQRMDLPGFIEHTLAETGFPAERLILEVTEDTLAESDGTTLADLHRLKRLGVSLAVDDFGTGYSSLAYLKTLPIDVLKIDKAFVAGVPEDANDSAIVWAVVAMGAAMGLEVVAEGVETAANRDFLREAGCLVGQGFLWGKPSPQPFAEQG